MLYGDGYVSLDIDERMREVIRFNPIWKSPPNIYTYAGEPLLTGKYELKLV